MSSSEGHFGRIRWRKNRSLSGFFKGNIEQNKHNFTEGGIFQPLLRFALPVLFALFLQAMYGAVDLMIVGRFTEDVFVSAHVSAVSTGSQIMMTLTNLVASFAMGATVLLGQQIGEGRRPQGSVLPKKYALLQLSI